MLNFRFGFVPLSVALVATCFGQDRDPKGYKFPPTTSELAAKTGMPPVKGMTAEERMRGYEQRLKLEADSPYSKVLWRSIGPETQGGRVVGIHTPESKPDSLFVGFATGGLWRTDDHGISWKSLFDGQSAFGIGEFALSKDGQTIWVGTGEANNQRTSYSGTGIFKSTDGGKTWKNMGLPEAHHIGKVVIDPQNENTVYVAAMGHLYSENSERGIYKTTDGGITWKQVLKINDTTGVNDLAIDPKNPKVLYASAVDRTRRAWNYRDGGPGSGLYKTENGGATWTLLTHGLPKQGDLGRTGIAVAPSSPNIVYAFFDSYNADTNTADYDERAASGELTPRRFLLLDEEKFLKLDKKVLEPFFSSYVNEDLKLDDAIQQVKDKKLTVAGIKASMEKRNPDVFADQREESMLYRSDDGGKNWRRLVNDHVGELGGYYYQTLFVNPKDPNDVFACGVLLYRSKDGGKTWDPAATSAHVDFHSVWFDPRDPNHMAVGSDGGIYVSGDGGQDWRHLNNTAVGQFTTIAVDDNRPFNVIGGLQDNGTMMGPSSYVPGRSDPQDWKTVGGGDGSAVAIDPRDDSSVIYVASQFGAHSAENLKTRQRWNARPSSVRGEPALRFNWVSPIALSTFDEDIVYVGAQRLMRSFDQGRHFTAISPDLTKNRTPGNVPFSTIKDLSESPFSFGTIYVGCDDGNVAMTHDGGYQWNSIPTPTPMKWVSRVVASKWSASRVYVAQSGYREDDFAPYLYVSDDFGKTWRSIAANLPTETVNVIREDPNNDQRLFVGTDMGVFMSSNLGKSWEALAGGLPHTPVHDLAVQARDHALAIATHARSCWVLSLTEIEQLTDDIRKKDLYLFPVSDVERDPRLELQAAPAWIATPNPKPEIAVTLFSQAAGTAAIRVKDKAGKVVKESKMDVVRGLNFLTIDMELSAPKPGSIDVSKRQVKSVEDALSDPYASERPKYVPFGEYTFEVQVGDRVASTTVKIKEGQGGPRRRRRFGESEGDGGG